jgi:hypothetical protein
VAQSVGEFMLARLRDEECSSANNANVLEISAVGGAKTPSPSPTPEWGLHLLDANIALGNLISIVKAESAAFVRSRR